MNGVLLTADSFARVPRAYGTAALAVLSISTGFFILEHVFGHNQVFGLAPLFDLNGERTFPTMLAFIGFCSISLLALAAAQCSDLPADSVAWRAIAVLGLWLGLDEALSFHEQFLDTARSIAVHPVMYYGWYLFYVPVVGVMLLPFVPFFRRLPRATTAGLLLAGLVFIGGAVGVEAFGGYVAYQRHYFQAQEIAGLPVRAVYELEVLVEECMEFAGVWLALRALARHVANRLDRVYPWAA
jgi:hypothetical protein